MPIDPVIDPVLNRLEAEKASAEAARLALPPEGLLRAGGEAMAGIEPDEVLTPAHNAMISTLEDPMISVEASEQRVKAAFDAGVLQSALDAAIPAKASSARSPSLSALASPSASGQGYSAQGRKP